MSIISYKDLLVWQNSIGLVEAIYSITKTFPKEETYGICNQLQRAAVSIPSNIAEGSMRSTKADFKRFIYISLGSIAEVETLVEIAQRLQYIDQTSCSKLVSEITLIRKMLYGLKDSLK